MKKIHDTLDLIERHVERLERFSIKNVLDMLEQRIATLEEHGETSRCMEARHIYHGILNALKHSKDIISVADFEPGEQK
jgi:hypothetical protein